jgi:putative tryptophan/tyrosine transport system permease protein
MTGLGLLSSLNDILYDALPYGLVCLGLLWTVKYTKFPDLTCSGTFVFGGALAAISSVKWGCSPALSTMFAIMGGALGGLLTSLFYVSLRIDRMLSGILSAFVLYSVNLLLIPTTLAYRNNTLLSTAERWDRQIMTPSLTVSWHPAVIIILLAFVIGTKIFMDIFLASEMGLAFRSLEDDDAGEVVLLRQGLSPGMYRLLALTVGNGIIGLAGALVSFKENAANAHRGFDVLVTGLIVFLVGMQFYKLFETASRFKPLSFLSGLRNTRLPMIRVTDC